MLLGEYVEVSKRGISSKIRDGDAYNSVDVRTGSRNRDSSSGCARDRVSLLQGPHGSCTGKLELLAKFSI